jgi:hypothetical protein
VKEGKAEPLLELDQLMADRGLCEVDVFRGRRHGAVVGDRGENAQVTDLENHRAFPMAGVNDVGQLVGRIIAPGTQPDLTDQRPRLNDRNHEAPACADMRPPHGKVDEILFVGVEASPATLTRMKSGREAT